MKKILISLILVFIFKFNVNAQSYNFTKLNGVYANLVSPTSLTGNAYWNDTTFSVPIGFPFTLGSSTYNTAEIDANGVIFFNSGSNSAAIAAYNADLVDRGAAAVSAINYQLTGAAGSRIFKVEWKNAGFFDGTQADFVNFQVWIYEGSNKIETHVGTSSIGTPSNIFGSAGGPANGIATTIDPVTGAVSGLFLQGNPAAPTPVTLSNSTTYTSLNGSPANGTVYIYSAAVTGLPQSLSNKMLSVYPNPNQGECLIKLNGFGASKITLSLNDLLGKEILVKTLKVNGTDFIEKLQLPKTKGIYLLKIAAGNQVINRKIAVE